MLTLRVPRELDRLIEREARRRRRTKSAVLREVIEGAFAGGAPRLVRLTLPPGPRTGLKSASQVIIDKIVSVPRGAVSGEIGNCDAGELDAVDDGLRRWLEIAPSQVTSGAGSASVWPPSRLAPSAPVPESCQAQSQQGESGGLRHRSAVQCPERSVLGAVTRHSESEIARERSWRHSKER